MIEAGNIYADQCANAVFLMVAGKPNRPVGAELRGTGPRVWRGLAVGTRKDQGYVWIGTQGSSKLILCEAAIDAISCAPPQDTDPNSYVRWWRSTQRTFGSISTRGQLRRRTVGRRNWRPSWEHAD